MPTYPLSTSGSQIVDATGTPVLLRGHNWFGGETDIGVPHGLWIRNYKDQIDQMVELGYNTIRLPYSNDNINDPNPVSNGIDFALNPDLQGLTKLEVMDKVIDYAASQGMSIILDRHRPTSAEQSELWYTPEVPESQWISDWEMLAQRYANQPAVIGADLHNEPKTDWDSWSEAAERAGNAIHAVNANWLVLVEGTDPTGENWLGGNLTGVATNPVDLTIPNKLVYAPHEYGMGVFNQPWLSDPNYPNNLPERWDEYWGFIAKEGIAPILIGEWGGKNIGVSGTSEYQWAEQLTAYIAENDLHFTYWSWNPNSSDTGGILQDDWMTVDQSKQSVIQPLLNATPPDPEALPEEPEPPVEEPTRPIEEEESMAITVVSVADGDTITVNKDGENVSIRFSCIDAPELSQSPFGLAAKTRLREILPVGTVVTLREIGEDQFNRLVAEVYKDGESINLQLVAEGHAVIYPEYFGECAATQGAYTEAQEAAQEERLNFWNQDNPLMPWLFRSLDPAPTTCNFVSLPTNPILTTGVTDNEARISFASSGMTVDKSSSSGTFSIIVKRTGDLSKGISANVVLHPGYGHPKAFEYSNNRQIVAWGENDSTDKLVSFNILPTNRPFEHVTAVFSDWFNCSSGQYSEIQLCLDN